MSIHMTFKLTDDQLADSLLKAVIERVGVEDDKMLIWGTRKGVVCRSDSKTVSEVSKDKYAAALVDAYNVLKYGNRILL